MAKMSEERDFDENKLFQTLVSGFGPEVCLFIHLPSGKNRRQSSL